MNIILTNALCTVSGVDSASNRNENQEYFLWSWCIYGNGIRLHKIVNALNHNLDSVATSCYWWYSIWERDCVSRCNEIYYDVNLKQVFKLQRGSDTVPLLRST